MFLSRKVLVLGDVILDMSLKGIVSRLTPDAPVPVVHVQEERLCLGGAGNVSEKLSSLGLQVTLIATVGNDPRASLVKNLLQENNIGSRLLPMKGLTTTKCLVHGLAEGGDAQKLLRLDYEQHELSFDEQHEVLVHSIEEVQQTDAVILSDYLKGVCSFEVCQAVIQKARTLEIPVIVDPKGKEWNKYDGATLIKPNLKEFCLATGTEQGVRDHESIIEIGRKVIRDLTLQALLVTLDKDGMLLIEEKRSLHLPAEAESTKTVIGAGDTVIATIGAGLVSGYTLEDAVGIASTAVSLLVEGGTESKVTQSSIQFRKLGLHKSKVVEPRLLGELVELLRGENRKIIFTNGCFDILHRGHIYHLKEAKELGDTLIVGLNSDNSVRKVKGPGRPVMPLEDRLAIITSLSYVDYVVVFDSDTPEELIKTVNPDLLVKGENTTHVVGEEFARQVKILPLLGDYSSRKIIKGFSTTP